MLLRMSLLASVLLLVGNCVDFFGLNPRSVGVRVSSAELVRAGGVFGAVCNQSFDKTVTKCSGSTFSDGSACGTTSSSVLKSNPYTGTRKYRDKVCDTKTVNGRQITCGSARFDEGCS
ncbi:MAG: hypothetical protein KatS3mg111_3881 [Pirellulaceae bacterium]|nr:MAG: hypothetical protein KatS3mg111_3881 [Pirellulaceae bacterium]